jgi:pyruvate kinase
MAAQLVATLGPASFHLAPDLVAGGACALRLNASHMTPGELGDQLAKVRRQLPQTPIVVDLQGAKMRLGHFAEQPVAQGDHVVLSLDGRDGAVPVPHPELFRSIHPGESLSVDDDRVRLRVIDATAHDLRAACLQGGMLRPRKGINIVEHPVQLDDLTPADQAHVREALGFPGVGFAVSFVSDGCEAGWVRARATDRTVIGKIERAEGVARIAQLAPAFDALWICRGDLGAQLGPVALARWLSGFRPDPGAPVWLAGQILEHLTAHTSPTRSEVCHLYDIVQRGYAGIVLSDETAVGTDPAAAVRLAAGLLRDMGATAPDTVAHRPL